MEALQKQDDPKISVVIPAFNRRDTVNRCLDSVLAQTPPPFEVIVVDDCSSDKTVDAVTSYPERQVRCVSLEKRCGAQAARNRGVAEAKGDWIAFQDSDDEWLPGKLMKQLDALADSGFDPWTVVHGDSIWLDASGKEIKVDLPQVEGEDAYAELLTRPGPMFQSLLVSKLALQEIGYLDVNVPSYQEWDTAIRLAQRCRFVHIREPLFIYHLHQGETISKDAGRGIAGYQYVIDKFREEILAVCGTTVWESHLKRQLVHCLNNRMWDEATRYWTFIQRKERGYKLLQLCRLLHLRPASISALKTFFFSQRKG